MKLWRKLTAVTLAATMVIGIFAITGCNKKKKEGEIISEDAPWYDYVKVELSADYFKDYDKLEYVSFNYLGTSGDNYVMSVDGSLKIEEDVDWEKIDWSDYQVSEIAIYSPEGKRVNNYDISDIVNTDNEWISDSSLVDGKIQFTIETYDKNYNSTYSTCDLDLSTGDVSKRVKLDDSAVKLADDEYNEGDITIGDYKVSKIYRNEGEGATYRLIIADASGKSTSIDMGKEFPKTNIWNIDSVFQKSETEALVITAEENDFGRGIYDLNLKDCTIEQRSESDIEWLSDVSMYNAVSCNGATYTCNANNVTKIDFEKNEAVEVFNYSECNMNRMDTNNAYLIDISDDRLVFLADTSRYYSYVESKDESCMFILTKAATNPNAGKTIIEACCLNGVSEPVANAVCEFNDTNEQYFIKFSDRYNVDDNFEYTDDMTAEDWDNAYRSAQASLSNELAIDLMNGDGPDIILGGFEYGQLNNDSYLADLSSHMSEFGVSGYFSNVFDGAKVDGKIFQVPLSFSLCGIVTDKKNVGKNQSGFTFDEYKTFVDKVCNGKDPIFSGQVSYLNTCMDGMSDIFLSDGRASYDNEAFRELASYVKDNVNEEMAYEGDDEVIVDVMFEAAPASYSYIYGFSSFLDCWEIEAGPQNLALLGLPSYDGRGASIRVSDSVAISAQCVDEDACWEFIETLLGADSQESYAVNYAFPVSVDAYEKVANSMVEFYNKEVSGNAGYSISGRGQASEIDKSIVSQFETDCIEASHVVIIDPSISVIVSEEIPAYLSGQKDIDQVIEILEDRVNTVLNERG